jgi:hypothetical protein
MGNVKRSENLTMEEEEIKIKIKIFVFLYRPAQYRYSHTIIHNTPCIQATEQYHNRHLNNKIT